VKIRIGTRGSDLALWQANFTKSQLTINGNETTITIIKTQGDKIQNLSFDKLEGKGFFTKEIEDHLLANEIDLAVHSHKDLETTEPEGLTVAAVSSRENPAELLIIKKESVDNTQEFKLKRNAVVGTSSARRKNQLAFFRPDIVTKDLRGNVPTRVGKLNGEIYDAILLAKAGVDRLKLDLSQYEVVVLDPRIFIPAPAQGVLAWQINSNNSELRAELLKLNDSKVSETTRIERSILKGCDGGCQLPLGVYCERENESYNLWVSFAPTVDQPALRFYLENESSEELIKVALERIDNYHSEKKKF
jgi:hydroxymethylbilane synthase